MNGEDDVIGFLAADGVLYCSRECARKSGHSDGYEVDQDEYDGMIGEGTARAGAVCPGCGAEFAIEWTEREQS